MTSDDGRWLVAGALLGMVGVGVAARGLRGSRVDGVDDQSRQGHLQFGFDRPSFTHYVVLEGKIVSAWDSFDEARAYVEQDLPALGSTDDATIRSRSEVRRAGLDPANITSWWG